MRPLTMQFLGALIGALVAGVLGLLFNTGTSLWLSEVGLTTEEIALVEAATAPREEPAEDDSAAAKPAQRPRKRSKFWDGGEA